MRRADKLQISHFASMGPQDKGASESLADWIHRRRRGARDRMRVWRIKPVSQILFESYAKWAGHMTRHGGLAARLYAWRCLAWWHGHLNEGPQHTRLRRPVGRPIRWEDALVECVGIGWTQEVHDREGWQQQCRTATRRWCEGRAHFAWQW
jgi:hypothetical protein